MRESAPTPRRGTPRELFPKTVEPFLVGDPVEQKQRGRIARSAIERIWSWIGRDLAPAEATIFCDEAGRALIADDAARGLRTELDLSSDTPWTRRLAAIRIDVSDVLKAEIESVPGRVRRLLRPRPASEIARSSMPDASEVAETEALIELVGACRNYASELAISEMTLRAYSEVQHHLDTGTRSVLDDLRHAGEGDRRFRQSQVDAAVRFCAKVFGQEYASLLGKAAEVAANAAGERKVAAKA